MVNNNNTTHKNVINNQQVHKQHNTQYCYSDTQYIHNTHLYYGEQAREQARERKRVRESVCIFCSVNSREAAYN